MRMQSAPSQAMRGATASRVPAAVRAQVGVWMAGAGATDVDGGTGSGTGGAGLYRHMLHGTYFGGNAGQLATEAAERAQRQATEARRSTRTDPPAAATQAEASEGDVDMDLFDGLSLFDDEAEVGTGQSGAKEQSAGARGSVEGSVQVSGPLRAAQSPEPASLRSRPRMLSRKSRSRTNTIPRPVEALPAVPEDDAGATVGAGTQVAAAAATAAVSTDDTRAEGTAGSAQVDKPHAGSHSSKDSKDSKHMKHKKHKKGKSSSGRSGGRYKRVSAVVSDRAATRAQASILQDIQAMRRLRDESTSSVGDEDEEEEGDGVTKTSPRSGAGEGEAATGMRRRPRTRRRLPRPPVAPVTEEHLAAVSFDTLVALGVAQPGDDPAQSRGIARTMGSLFMFMGSRSAAGAVGNAQVSRSAMATAGGGAGAGATGKAQGGSAGSPAGHSPARSGASPMLTPQQRLALLDAERSMPPLPPSMLEDQPTAASGTAAAAGSRGGSLDKSSPRGAAHA